MRNDITDKVEDLGLKDLFNIDNHKPVDKSPVEKSTIVADNDVNKTKDREPKTPFTPFTPNTLSALDSEIESNKQKNNSEYDIKDILQERKYLLEQKSKHLSSINKQTEDYNSEVQELVNEAKELHKNAENLAKNRKQ